MIVLDASAALELLLNTPRASRIRDRVLRRDESVHAPHLLDLEVAQVLRRYVANREMSAQRGAEALGDFMDLPIHRYPHDLFLARIWALRDSLTAYDAAYVALAESLEAPLLTCDARLHKSHGHRARIEVF